MVTDLRARVRVGWQISGRERGHSDRRSDAGLLEEARAGRGKVGARATTSEDERAGVHVARGVVVGGQIATHKRVPSGQSGDRARPCLAQEFARATCVPGDPLPGRPQ